MIFSLFKLNDKNELTFIHKTIKDIRSDLIKLGGDSLFPTITGLFKGTIGKSINTITKGKVFKSLSDIEFGEIFGFIDRIEKSRKLELKVSDEEFYERLDRDKILLNDFFNEYEKGSITVEKAMSNVGIAQEKNANLFHYLSNQTIDGLKDSKNATDQYVNSQKKQHDILQKGTLSILGMKAAQIALNAAVDIGIGLLVNFAMSKITELITANERAVEKAHELTDAWSEQRSKLQGMKSTIDDIGSDYEKLSQGVDSLGRNIGLNTEEYTRYNDIVNQIADMFPEMIAGYTDEGNAILKHKGDIEELTKAYQEYNQSIKDKILLDANDVLKGYQTNFKNNGFWSGLLNPSGVDKIGKEVSVLENLINAINNNDYSLLPTSESNDFAVLIDSLKGILEDDDIDRISGNLRITFEDFEKIKLNLPLIEKQYKNTVKELNSETSSIKPILSTLLESDTDFQKFNSETQDVLSNIITSFDYTFFKNFNTREEMYSWIRENLINPLLDQETSDEFKDALYTYSDLINNGFDNLTFTDYQNIIEELKNVIPNELWNTIKIHLNLEFDVNDALKQAYDKIVDSIRSSGITDIDLRDFMSQIYGFNIEQIQVLLSPDFTFDPNSKQSLEEQIDNFAKENNIELSIDTSILTEGFEKYNNIISESTNVLNDYKSSVSSLNETIDKLNSGTALNGAEMLDLIMNYPELASQIQATNDGYSISIEALKILREQELLKAQDGIKAQIEHAKAVVESTMSVVGAYGLQLNAIKSLADAEAALAGGQFGPIGVLDLDKFNEDATEYNGEKIVSESPDFDIKKVQSAVLAARTSLKIGELYDQLAALQLIDINKITSGSGSEGSSSSNESSEDKWKEEAENLRANLDHLYKMELITIEEYYDGLNEIDKKYFEGREKYISEHRSYLEELFDLQRQMSENRIKDIEHEIYKLQQVENTEQKQIELYKNIANEINNQLKAAYDYGLDQHSDYVQELEKQWYEYNQNIIDIYKNQQSEIEQQMDEFKSKQSSMFSEFMSIWDDEIESLNEAKEAEQEYWDQKIEDYKKEHEELEEINELEEKRLKLQNLKKQRNTLLYDEEKGWIRTYDHAAVDEAQKDYDDSLAEKEYQDGLEDLENRRDEAIKAIDDEIEAINDLKDEWQNALDEINKQYEFNEEELKAFADFANMTREEQLEYLGNFVEGYKTNLDSMISKIEELTIAINNAADAMNNLSGTDYSIGTKYENTSGSPYDAPDINSGNSSVKDSLLITNEAGQVVKMEKDDVTWKGQSPSQSQILEWEKNGWTYVGNGGWKFKNGQTVYKMGGVASDTGLAMLHGDSAHSEVVFNSNDAKKLYDYIHETPSLIKELFNKVRNIVPDLKPSKPINNVQKSEQHFHISQLSFPNVVSGQDVIEAIQELPNFVLQNKFKK